ncbi:alpha/beta fold hydrolase [Rugosimonospora acidiphila]|uniref:Alpha/beta fold hydrolase n=1 Tax=Rugosimonospora acidiphila TaxID=556531 RepID=A0ABP9SB87_9ACTN
MRRSHGVALRRRRFLLPVAAAAALLLSPLAYAAPAEADPAPATCTDVSVPVTLDLLLSAHVHAQLCVPTGPHHTAIQVLIPGATYNSYYWDFPYQPATYSYVRAANEAGYPTLNIDRVGTGQSTKEPSLVLTAVAQAAVVHQVIQKLRAGGVGGTAFSKVILVGHSLGSGVTEVEASTYHDVDGVVLTGATHHVSVTDLTQAVLTAAYPAALDPKFGLSYDVGYITTIPGKRASVFYNASDTDPAVVAVDEANKDVVSLTEMAGAVLQLTGPATLGIKVPVLLVQGGQDFLFCSGLIIHSDCSSSTALYQQESGYFSPAAQLHVYVLPGAGHDLNLERNAADYRQTVMSWANQFVPDH